MKLSIALVALPVIFACPAPKTVKDEINKEIALELEEIGQEEQFVNATSFGSDLCIPPGTLEDTKLTSAKLESLGRDLFQSLQSLEAEKDPQVQRKIFLRLINEIDETVPLIERLSADVSGEGVFKGAACTLEAVFCSPESILRYTTVIAEASKSLLTSFEGLKAAKTAEECLALRQDVLLAFNSAICAYNKLGMVFRDCVDKIPEAIQTAKIVA